MAELLDNKIKKLQWRLEELKRNLPTEENPFLAFLEIEQLKRKLSYLDNSTPTDLD